jgi:hypothetical protein
MHLKHILRSLYFLLTPLLASAEDAAWPMGSGPNGNYCIQGAAPAAFSVSLNQHVRWRAPLPNTGQSAAVIAGKRLFVTSHEPIAADTEMGSTIYGMCFDAETGKELWRRTLPGARVTDLSSLFSDNTAAAPVVTDTRVCFVNVGGCISCFDHDGTEQWTYTWVPFGRHHARAQQPILQAKHIIVMQIPRQDLDPSVTTKGGAHPLGRDEDLWTRLMRFDLQTGKRDWVAACGTSVHSNSMIGKTADGTIALLTGRGGGHKPPEEPYGLSLVQASDGVSRWDRAIKGYAAAQNACWTPTQGAFFAGAEHGTIDIATGQEGPRMSLVQDVDLCAWENGVYVHKTRQTLAKIKKPLTYYTNIIVGDYHYFRAHSACYIGRVQLQTGKVEYLQVPIQVLRKPGEAESREWTQAIPNDMKNTDGFVATQDKRNAGSGWGHVSSASPIVVGERIYFPTMIGMVYVLNWNAPRLDETALVSISDLGPAGETWCLANLSYAEGNLYARTLKELICIGPAPAGPGESTTPKKALESPTK